MFNVTKEINKISKGLGYDGTDPKNVTKAINILTNTLAGEQVATAKKIAPAISELAPYISAGGEESESGNLIRVAIMPDRSNYPATITDDPDHPNYSIVKGFGQFYKFANVPDTVYSGSGSNLNSWGILYDMALFGGGAVSGSILGNYKGIYAGKVTLPPDIPDEYKEGFMNRMNASNTDHVISQLMFNECRSIDTPPSNIVEDFILGYFTYYRIWGAYSLDLADDEVLIIIPQWT